MEHLTAKLVFKNAKQRYYQLNHKLTVGCTKYHNDLLESLKEATTRVKDEYKHIVPEGGVDLICISDARSHIERLVFAAVVYDNGKYGRLSPVLDGVNTMMIHGGDSRCVYSPEVYLRRLAKANGYVFDWRTDINNSL